MYSSLKSREREHTQEQKEQKTWIKGKTVYLNDKKTVSMHDKKRELIRMPILNSNKQIRECLLVFPITKKASPTLNDYFVHITV